MIRLRTIIFLFLMIWTVSANRVLLRDISSITLHRGQQTTGRRASPVPQLQCVGGTASGRFSPKVVQCYNRGFDGLNPQWECQSEMPVDYQFGRISVTCEGYDYSEDPYVLAGSCGLKYELDYSTSGAKRATHSNYNFDNSANYTYIIYFILIAFVLYMLYLSMTSTRDGHEGDRYRGGSYYPGDDDSRGNGPHPPGWRQPPPSYDDATSKGRRNQNTGTGSTSNYGGFWSGLGLGALGGYLGNQFFSNRNNYGGTTYRRRGPTQFERDTGFYTDSYDQPGPSHYRSSTPPSSNTHTSSGFGGTERR
ncbi:Store-operated calcium entry-associated regulatory factor [Aphelenchoides bicaudatus]|nr:Store-operated calcium entry-associated regulatory factor [Aphelenchoides bicaudatus]